MISQVSRFRRCAIRAVAQKTHPIGTADLRRKAKAYRAGLCNGIKTVSTAKPSPVRNSSF